MIKCYGGTYSEQCNSHRYKMTTDLTSYWRNKLPVLQYSHHHHHWALHCYQVKLQLGNVDTRRVHSDSSRCGRNHVTCPDTQETSTHGHHHYMWANQANTHQTHSFTMSHLYSLLAIQVLYIRFPIVYCAINISGKKSLNFKGSHILRAHKLYFISHTLQWVSYVCCWQATVTDRHVYFLLTWC